MKKVNKTIDMADKLIDFKNKMKKTVDPLTCYDFNLTGFTCPTNATRYCRDGPIDAYSATQAKEACEVCYGQECALNGPIDGFYNDGPTDCAGFGYGPPPGVDVPCFTAFFGYQDGFAQCTGKGTAGRIWRYCSSFDPAGTFGRWAPLPANATVTDVADEAVKVKLYICLVGSMHCQHVLRPPFVFMSREVATAIPHTPPPLAMAPRTRRPPATATARPSPKFVRHVRRCVQQKNSCFLRDWRKSMARIVPMPCLSPCKASSR